MTQTKEYTVKVDATPVVASNATITATYSLVVSGDKPPAILAAIDSSGRVTISPKLAAVCGSRRVQRNLIAAKKGSEKAKRFIAHCAQRVSDSH